MRNIDGGILMPNLTDDDKLRSIVTYMASDLCEVVIYFFHSKNCYRLRKKFSIKEI